MREKGEPEGVSINPPETMFQNKNLPLFHFCPKNITIPSSMKYKFKIQKEIQNYFVVCILRDLKELNCGKPLRIN